MDDQTSDVKEEISENPNDECSGSTVWRDWYLVVQGLFYFAQGAAFAAIILIPVYFQDTYGLSEDVAVRYQSLIMLPWYIKIIFGLLSDNVPFGRFGKRRPYILLAGIFGLIGWFAFPSISEVNGVKILMGIFLAASVAVADTVVDSLGVDITPAHRRSHMQGVGWGFRGLGSALAGAILGILIGKYDYSIAYYITGILMVLGCFVAIFLKEPMKDGKVIIHKVTLQDFKTEFSKKETWIITLFNIFGGIGIAIVPVLSIFLKELGITIEGIGWGVTFFALGQFVGALSFGYLGQKFNLKSVLSASVGLYVILILSFFVIPFDNTTVLYIILVLVGAINGGFEATQMRISMEFSVGPLSGTMYSWYNSMSNVAQTAIGANIIASIYVLSGSFAGSLQIASVFLLLTLIPGYHAIKKLKSR